MSLKLYKRGCIWWMRGTVRSIPLRESTKTDRREVADEIRIKREAELLERSVHGAKAVATYTEAAVMYMEAGGERRYQQPLIDHFRGTKLGRIDQTALDRAGRVILPSASDSTRNRQVYTPVSAVLKFASKRGLCEYRKIERPKQPKGRVRWITPEEADQLIDSCSPHMARLVIFMLYTGARMSEALYLDWHNVDLNRRQVWFEETKNGEARGVPLHSRVVAALANLPHREGAVFLRPGKKVGGRREMVPYARRDDHGGGQIKTGFNAACRRAGIEDFSPHCCRHTWATWLYAETRDLLKLKELGGWKSLAMVERYAHVNTSHLQSAIDLLPDSTKSAQSKVFNS